MSRLVSVVIPCYNEEENVPLLVEKVSAVFSDLCDYDFELLLVNDHSADGTGAQIERLAEADAHIRPIHLTKNCGQSAALVAGMRRAKGEYVLTLDGDLQNDPCDFPKLLELLQAYDCVCGYRANRQDSWPRLFVSRYGNLVRRWLVDDGTRDAGCGTKGFRRACVEHIVAFNGVHRFFAAMVRNGGLTVTECPVTHHPRIHGVSKYGIGNRLWRFLFDLVGVAWLRRRYVNPRVEGEE